MENAPELKKRRLLMSLSKHHFASVSKEILADMTNYKMPENSAKCSKWVLKNLGEWFDDYNKRNPDNLCHDDVLSPTCSKALLNKWLCVYIDKTRSCTSEPYPPKTVYSLLCRILRDMRACNPTYPNFLDKHDTDFSDFTRTLDNLSKSLRSTGVGSLTNSAEELSSEDESCVVSGVFNLDSPKGLLHAAFFYCGKCFCLHGGLEHWNFKMSQLERHYRSDL